MSAEVITENRIGEFLKMRKHVQNPRARTRPKKGHDEIEYELLGEDSKTRFRLYTRQNRKEPEDFSCGLRVELRGGEELPLVRYNGPSHPHKNEIEATRVDFRTHIHFATERYILRGRKPDGFAEATDKYENLNQALRCLLRDFSITGLSPTEEPDNQQPLFEQ
jgi:hypothetical protein